MIVDLTDSQATFSGASVEVGIILIFLLTEPRSGSGWDFLLCLTSLSVYEKQTMELYDKKETDSPRFKALLRLTCGLSKKKSAADITSFSHELSSTASTLHPYLRFQNVKNSEVSFLPNQHCQCICHFQ